MAFIDQQDEDQAQGGQGGGASPLVGGGSQNVGANLGQTAAPAGRGGSSGGWVNLQTYLGANAGDTGSAQALNQTVGSQFDKEKDTFNNDSSAFIQNAQTQVDKEKISNDDADKSIKNAATEYNWQGKPNENYQQTVDKFQNALTGQYKGPKDYAYGFGAQTQGYGDQLKDSTGFDGLMSNVYSRTAKSPLTSGQFELQKQLDVNNTALVDARQNLNQRYDQLGKDRDAVVKSTTDSLGGLEKQFRTNQNSLRDYLGSQANSYDTQGAQAEADARAAYNKEYTTGQSSIGDSLYDRMHAASGNYGDGTSWWMGNLDNGKAGNNWQDLQQLMDGGNRLNSENFLNYSMDVNANGAQSWADYDSLAQLQGLEGNYRNQAQQSLTDFYGAQDAKYAETGDEQDRSYNAIQDFLNSTTDRKKQGFRVRD